MAHPLFGAGQRVNVAHAGRVSTPAGIYNVVRALPAEHGPVQYRIKSDTEAFERIVDETRLEAVQN
ncbi:MAG: hypothetical protein ABL883_02810 [Terricaulis sp.]